MRKYLLVFGLILFTSSFSLGQTIAFQDFEGGSDNWSFTADPVAFEVGSDIWTIKDDSWQASDLTTMASSGANFWGIQDLANGNGGTASGEFGTLTFPNVDVSSFSGVEITFDYDVFEFDGGDDVKYEAFFDDVSQGEVLLIDGTSNLSENGTVTISVPNGTGTVSLIVSVSQNGGGDYAGLDNFKVAVASGPDPEPSNHATSFSAVANGHNQIDLSWTDATGAQLPAGYLIKGSDISFAAILAPVDGTPEADAGLIKNVAQGVQAATITGLTESTQYFFKIFPYTNSGATIDYKTDGTVPQDDATTGVAPSLPNLVINEILADPDPALGDANGDGTVSTTNDEFVEIVNIDGASVDISGYTLEDGFGLRHTFEASTVIPDGQSVVVFGGGTPTNIPGTSFIASTGALGLNNSGDDVILKDDLGNIVASYTYGSEGGDDQSLARDPDFLGPFVKHSTITTNPVLFSPGKENIGGTDLPVELTSFSASVIKNSVKLVWNTATEINNYGFEIQRSADKEVWSNVGFINGSGTTNAPKEYSYVDSKLSNSSSYYYRLKQVDNDGSYEFSKAIEVVLGTPTEYELGQNYPNPFNPSTLISFTLPEAGYTSLIIYNSLGQEVAELVNNQLEAGSHQYNFDAKNLTSGIYFYKLESENFVQVRKMMLLK